MQFNGLKDFEMTREDIIKFVVLALTKDVVPEVRKFAAEKLLESEKNAPPMSVPVYKPKHRIPSLMERDRIAALINDLMSTYKLKKYEIANKAGLSSMVISNWISRGSISQRSKQYFVLAFPDFHWGLYKDVMGVEE